MNGNVLGFFLLGALTWTLLEYLLHRFFGHDKRFSFTPFAKEHVRHHVEGNYFAPTWKKLLVAVLFGAALTLPASMLIGRRGGVAYVSGLMMLYAVYEVLHRLEHTHAGIGPYARWARRHHFHHHFMNGRANHGVTSPLWDFVFGTYEKPSVIKVPPQLCMRWLRDPESGDVRADWAETFVLRQKERWTRPRARVMTYRTEPSDPAALR